MNVCFFGSYAPNYSRNRNLIKGLSKNRIKAFECRAEGQLIFRYPSLILKFLRHRHQVKHILVGFPGHYDIFLAFVLGKIFKKKVIYDIFASLYETYALDRKIVRKESLRAKFYFFIDWFGLKLADLVLVDANAHKKMYSKLYKLNPNKALTIYIGSDDSFFYPQKTNEDIDVLYQGSYQPLNGTEYIIQAAKLLPKVSFYMIGKGHDRPKTEKLARKMKLSNVKFIDWVEYGELNNYINRSKVLLGTLGKGEKANSTIPNKLYDAFACRKAIITGRTAAGHEILVDQKNCLLVESGEPKELATSIKKLLNDTKLRMKISINAYQDFHHRFAPSPMVQDLIQYLKQK